MNGIKSTAAVIVAAAFISSAQAGALDGGTVVDPVSGVAVGNGSAAGNGSTAVGIYAQASNGNGTAIGNNSSSNGGGGTGNVAIGYDAKIAPGYMETVSNAVALGSGSRAIENNTVSVGSTDISRRIVNVADGINNSDAVTVGQLNTVATATAAAQTAANAARTDVNNLTTRVSSLESIAGTDSTARATSASAVVAANAAQATANSAATAAGAAQTTANRAETKAEAAQATASSAMIAAGNVQKIAVRAESKADTAQATADFSVAAGRRLEAQINDFTSTTNQRFNSIDNRMDTMRKEYRAGVATATAGAHAIASAFQSGGLGVGIGTFGGQHAVSIGLATQVRQIHLTASIQHSDGYTGGGAGIGYRFN